MNPRYPVYVISKGRAESRLTSRGLESIGVPYRIVIEPQEYNEYAKVINPDKILQLPFSNLGQGSIPARNWVWEHSISEGHERHWILDDNLGNRLKQGVACFFRLFNNVKLPCRSGTVLKVAEDFTDRYENVEMSGFNYFMFASRKTVVRPYYLNTRVYSCVLLKNSSRFRWRGRYNEDTDLSIRILKEGFCTILFNSFLCYKQPTMTMTGGNTDKLYEQNEGFDGRLAMAESLREQHPDIVKATEKWGRYQHHVDYSGFRRNKLIRKPGWDYSGVDNYGMKLIEVDKLQPAVIADPVEEIEPEPEAIEPLDESIPDEPLTVDEPLDEPEEIAEQPEPQPVERIQEQKPLFFYNGEAVY